MQTKTLDKKPQMWYNLLCMQENEKQIKSKDRVRQVAEVFTAKKQVCDMLDLVKDLSFNPTATILEPSCGNGNFLAEVLMRKLMRVLELLKSGSLV